MEEDEKINLKRFKTHQRKFPWALFRKILIALTLIGVLWYAKIVLEEKQETEIELEFTD